MMGRMCYRRYYNRLYYNSLYQQGRYSNLPGLVNGDAGSRRFILSSSGIFYYSQPTSSHTSFFISFSAVPTSSHASFLVILLDLGGPSTPNLFQFTVALGRFEKHLSWYAHIWDARLSSSLGCTSTLFRFR